MASLASPPPPQPTSPRASRTGTAVALLVLAAVLVIAARSDTTTAAPRTGRRVELVELIRVEQARGARMEERVAELTKQVERFESRSTAGAAAVARLQRRIDRLEAPAGMTQMRGPGAVVTLSDSSLETSPSGNLNDLVIHEQDLQAVINALWAGGSEAMSVNGQRILATTAIRCVGNTLLLHGGVYSPPYVIRAVGDPVALGEALERDPAVGGLSAAATQYGLGFTVEADEALELPAYEGANTIKIAQPAPTGKG